MECLANTSSFDHACFKIDGFSFKRHSTKVGPIDIVHPPPQFLFECAPLGTGCKCECKCDFSSCEIALRTEQIKLFLG